MNNLRSHNLDRKLIQKPCLIACQLLLAIFGFNKINAQPRMDKIIIDKNLTSDLFAVDDARIPTRESSYSWTIVKNSKTGKTDTIINYDPHAEKITNCRIQDTGRNHYGFDNCIAYTFYRNDTVVLQIQNNNIELPKFQWWDRLVVKMINDSFYAEYIFANNSSYQLKVQRQKLVLKKLTRKRGDRLRGILTLECSNSVGRGRIPQTFNFEGPFDAVIQ